MIIVYGEEIQENVFQRNLKTLRTKEIIFPHRFVTGLSLTALILHGKYLKNIVQTKMIAVMAMIRLNISSVMKVKPAYQKVST